MLIFPSRLDANTGGIAVFVSLDFFNCSGGIQHRSKCIFLWSDNLLQAMDYLCVRN